MTFAPIPPKLTPVDYLITTPEQIQFRYPVAGLVSRATAWVIDQLLVFATLIAVAVAASSGGEFGLAFIFIAKFLLDFGYYAWFEHHWAGRTPGKRAMGIRVIAAHGGKLRFGDVLTRTFFRMIDNLSLIPFVALPGGAVAFLDPYHRRIGDLAADTIVVRDDRVALPRALHQQQNRVNTFLADAQLRTRILARVSREERDLIFDLMLRRDSLNPVARESLFRDAAEHFRKRFSLPQDLDYLSDEQTVLNLALVVQDTRFAG